MLSSQLRLSFLSGLLLIMIASGCQEKPEDKRVDTPPPFVFKSLELRQKRANGEQDWDLKSPLASYELGRRVVRAEYPKGILYNKNQPSFEISARNATVINDGEIVILEGDVRIQQLAGEKVLITGDRLRWTPKDSRMLIDQDPQALNDTSRIKAQTAEFHQSSQELFFKGPTQLHRWKEERNSNKEPNTEIKGMNGIWNLENGNFKASGPISGRRRVDKSQQAQKLTAARLQGNSKKAYLDLINPVLLMLPNKNTFLQAKDTRWYYNRDKIISNQPFLAKQENSTYRGKGFEVDLSKKTVEVTNDCEINQPGDKLIAQKCFLNWYTEKVRAKGSVVLNREANNLITHSDELNGRIGNDGTVIFSSPGSSVKSQLTINREQRKSSSASKSSHPIEF
ncbi:MAG: LPS export ABC transporter periplasmic protein LptC [Prochlorococcus sp.]